MMETSVRERLAALGALLLDRLRQLVGANVFGVKGSTAALVFLAVVVIGLTMIIALIPTSRRVVTKRRVRRVRRAAGAAGGPAVDTTAAATAVSSPAKRRAWGTPMTVAVWALAVLLVSVVSYRITSTERYCARSCHSQSRYVAAALKSPHATCIECHESGPVSGMYARIEMALNEAQSSRAESERPVESRSCLRCHADIIKRTTVSRRGIRVAHAQLVAAGYVCSDCHANVGHRRGPSYFGGMSRCMGCHDGERADRACATCHRQGSPLSVEGLTKESSRLDYPAIRVANRDCSRCHGAETECRACHNGLVLPHPKSFENGGHARMAAFGGKQKCYKCHSILWCGDGRCHHAFSAHNEKTWRVEHRRGSSSRCGSCHLSWSEKRGDFCAQCH